MYFEKTFYHKCFNFDYVFDPINFFMLRELLTVIQLNNLKLPAKKTNNINTYQKGKSLFHVKLYISGAIFHI